KTIDASATIDGGDAITISGGGGVRVFLVNAPAVVVIQNLRITDGYVSGDNGGGDFQHRTLVRPKTTRLNKKKFDKYDSDDGGYGGAIENISGTVTVERSVFSENLALIGAALFSSGGKLTVTDSTFFSNTSDSAGGYGSAIYSSFGAAAIVNSTFSANS